jgi:invasion protein IalB
VIALKRPSVVIGAGVAALALAGLGFVLLSGGADTEKPGAATTAATGTKPGAAESSSAPQKAVVSYGDWGLQCEQAGAPSKGRRNCEVFQNVMLQNQSQPFAQIAFGTPGQAAGLHMTVVVPINISFAGAVRVALDEKDPQPMVLDWTRCLPAGCFASAVVKDDTLRKWRATSALGRVSFASSSEQQIVMPVSFRGLAQALDALGKEP